MKEHDTIYLHQWARITRNKKICLNTPWNWTVVAFNRCLFDFMLNYERKWTYCKYTVQSFSFFKWSVWSSPVFNVIGCVTCTFDNCVGCNVGWSLTQMNEHAIRVRNQCFKRAAIKRPGQKQTIQWPYKVFGHLSHIQCIKYHALHNKTSTQVAFTLMKDSTNTHLHLYISTSNQ